MPWFDYEAVTAGGSVITGRLETADLDAARLELARLDLEVRRLHPAEPPPAALAHLSGDELIFFNQQLAGLARAGLALDEGLAQLAKDVQSSRLRAWIERLVDDLRRGTPLEQALAARETGLPVLYSQVVRAGIETGKLPIVLLNLNQHLQTTGTTRRIIWEAASYPLVLASLGLGVATFFFLYVLAPFRGIFAEFGVRPPLLTVIALKIADHWMTLLIILGSLAGVLVLIWILLRWTPGGLSLREKIVMLIPIVGGIHRASLTARFLRALAAAIETGIPLPRAIRLSSAATGSALLGSDADRLAGGIEAGCPILEANHGTRVIPPLFGYCVQAATARQNLPDALAELARAYEDRILHGHGLLRLLLLPLFILTIGGVLLFAIAAMFLPLISLINAVTGGW